jgi:guanine nucleotide-binding protein subunit alpha
MGVLPDPQDPLHVFLLPPPGETPEERILREEREVEEQRKNDLIEEDIKRQKAGLKKLVRVLLLGQAESGKSTTLKNFRVKYAYEEWVRERTGWRSVIQLNLIRSIIAIMETLRAQTDKGGAASPLPRGDRDSPVGDDTIPFRPSEKIQMLLLKLGPLRALEKEMKAPFGAASEEIRADDDGSSWHPFAKTSTPKQQQAQAEPTKVIASCREDMKSLWTDESVKNLLEKLDIHMEHSAGFFLNDIDRIATRGYEPTDEDILRARLRTVAYQEYKLKIDSSNTLYGSSDWVFYDVGGARSMRPAWVPFFDNANAIIFLAPVSTFDENLLEDPRVNRLEDSVATWKLICSSKLLSKVTLVLFLNKCDILKRKLKSGTPINKYLSSYGSRANDTATFLKYMRDKFVGIMRRDSPDPKRGIYCHATTIIDVKATSKTIADVQEGILIETLRQMDLV